MNHGEFEVSRSTAFFMNGGAGRVICSIPAFELYQKENPNDDFIIICEGGMDFFKGHPTLHNRAYDHWHKGLFEEHIKQRNCVTPEPYRIWEYYNQKCDLSQAFDLEINKKGLRKLEKPNLYLNKKEIVTAGTLIDEVKQKTGKDKILVIQPFGRSVEAHSDFIIDTTSRSFQLNNIVEIINTLKKEYGIIIMSEINVPLEEKENSQHPVAQPQIPDLRIWAAIIEIADHFLGCDSMGQHIVKALGGTATIITGSTYPINISYPDDPKFDIIDVGNGKRVYAPIRLTMEEEQDRMNDEVMELSQQQIDEVCNSVRKIMGSRTKEPQKQKTKLIPGNSNIIDKK